MEMKGTKRRRNLSALEEAGECMAALLSKLATDPDDSRLAVLVLDNWERAKSKLKK